jgi:hypothetical protein
MSAWTVVGVLSGTITLGCCLALVAVGARSRARMRGRLRRGGSEGLAGVPRQYRSSPTSLLAGWAGVGLMGMAVAGTVPGRGAPLARVALGTAGLLVAWTGFASRVVGLEVRTDGVLVHLRTGRPFVYRWVDARRLVPPITFIGGWRLVGATGSRTLMPSDLLGHEFVVELIVARTGMTRVGRVWTRRPRAGEPASRARPT